MGRVAPDQVRARGRKYEALRVASTTRGAHPGYFEAITALDLEYGFAGKDVVVKPQSDKELYYIGTGKRNEYDPRYYFVVLELGSTSMTLWHMDLTAGKLGELVMSFG